MEPLDSGVSPNRLPQLPSMEAAAAEGHSAPYLEGLNERQKDAVQRLDGPLLVLAGAGTGKTRTLTTRIAHILCTGRAWPSQILAVTFTNKAAAEMRQRVENMYDLKAGTLPWLGTFHSISARILRRHAELADLNQRFTILNDDDKLRLLKQLIKLEGIDDRLYPARLLSSIIDRWKNECWLPGDVPASASGAYNGKGIKLYRQYQERLKTLNAVDFGDLILHVCQMLRNNESVLERYHRQFRYILVDEYQDINTAQYLWLRLLTQGTGNLCCVGDEDQSIYGWRGAKVEHILGFAQTFPDSEIVRLEQNYRSTGHILAAASGLISHNRDRLGKMLRTDQQGGEKIRLIGHWDGEGEAAWIGGDIEALNSGVGRLRKFELSEMAILVRASFLMRELEERLLLLGIPYRVIGGPRFYERSEIRDALAYLRLAVSNADDLAFERVVNLPRRGVGEKAQQTIQILARNSGIPLLEAARRLLQENAFKGRTAIGLQKFVSSVEVWTSDATAGTEDPEELAGRIIDEAGLPEMWKNTATPDAEGRIENLKELVQSVGEFDNLEGFLEHVSLVMENLEDTEGDKVSIMTLHAAKGLEFPVVYLPGWEEGIFPSGKALEQSDTRGALEEERRLAHVGITRAAELCTISCTASRWYHGDMKEQTHSRFIDEIPDENAERLSPPGLMGDSLMRRSGLFDSDVEVSSFSRQRLSGGYSSPGFQRMVQRSARENTAGSRYSAPASKPDRAADFEIGDRVFHQKFGYGVVQSQEDDRVVVEFDCSGTKHLIARFLSRANQLTA